MLSFIQKNTISSYVCKHKHQKNKLQYSGLQHNAKYYAAISTNLAMLTSFKLLFGVFKLNMYKYGCVH